MIGTFATSELMTATGWSQLGTRIARCAWTGTSWALRSIPTPSGSTAVPGVWAAGNVTNIQAQVSSAAAAGLAAAAAVNNDLITNDAKRAVHAYLT